MISKLKKESHTMTSTWTFIRTLFRFLPNTHAMAVLLFLTSAYTVVDHYVMDLSPVTLVRKDKIVTLTHSPTEPIKVDWKEVNRQLDQMNWQLDQIIARMKEKGLIKEE